MKTFRGELEREGGVVGVMDTRDAEELPVMLRVQTCRTKVEKDDQARAWLGFKA